MWETEKEGVKELYREGESDRRTKRQRDKQQHKEDPLKSIEERVEEKLRLNRCEEEKKNWNGGGPETYSMYLGPVVQLSQHIIKPVQQWQHK